MFRKKKLLIDIDFYDFADMDNLFQAKATLQLFNLATI